MKQKIINIFNEISGYAKELINGETQIRDIGINSISIIQIMVKIEQEFEFEFDDEELDFSKIIVVEDLYRIVRMKVSDEINDAV